MRVSVPVADPNADVVADPEPLTAPRVVDLDLHRAYGEELAGLPRPWEMRLRVAAEPAGEDRLERVALLVGRAGGEVEDPAPG
jgi:hypothetical protein